MKNRLLKLFIFIFITAFAALSLSATDESAPTDSSNESVTEYPSELIFNELQLSPEGVIAYDTLGNRWRFDFDSGVFVPSRVSDEYTPEITIDPVEVRCTEERRVQDYEKTSVLIGYDEYVDGDIVAYGRVTVKGWVKGNIQSINKRVVVTESGQVDGGIKAPEIIVKEGGIVLGKQIVTTPFDIPTVDSFPYDFLVAVISLTAFFLLFGFLVVQLMPRQLVNFRECMCRHRVKTYLLGFLFVILMPVIVILVVITIVGTVVVILVPILYIIAIALGIISIGQSIGESLSGRIWGSPKSVLFSIILGVFAIMLPWIFTSMLFNSTNEVQFGFGIFFLVISIILSSFPVFSGVGAAILTRVGFRKYVSFADRLAQEPTLAPAPPPIPKEPPIITPPPIKPVKPDTPFPPGKGPLPSDE
ncbi:MAG: polymer-forming cytoskeletal protein [candidate division Zixibacteria bacterium]|nr:polymer-forming cytoskeletal protein [candidate division Zixibacteria bacterium]